MFLQSTLLLVESIKPEYKMGGGTQGMGKCGTISDCTEGGGLQGSLGTRLGAEGEKFLKASQGKAQLCCRGIRRLIFRKA